MGRRRISNWTLLGWSLLLLLLSVGIYSSRPILAPLAGCVGNNLRWFTINGRVVDVSTGRPIPGVSVRLLSEGPDILHLQPLSQGIWQDAVTSDSGKVRFRTRVLGRPQIYLKKSGYLGATAHVDTLEFRVALVPLPADAASVSEGFTDFPIVTRREAFRIDLLNLRAGVNLDSCDVVMTLLGSRERGIRLDAVDGASLSYVAGDRLATGTTDTYANECVAPETGYVASRVVTGADRPGICFVRTRDGERYGSFLVDVRRLVPERFAHIDSTRQVHVFEYLYLNRSGGRGQCGTSHTAIIFE